MKTAIIIAVIIVALFLIGLIRVGVDVIYISEEKTEISIIAGLLKIKLFPKKKTKQNSKNPKKPKKEKPKKDKPAVSIIKAVTLDDVINLMNALMRVIKRFRKSIVVHRFKFWFVSSNEDPYATISTYNKVNYVLCRIGSLTDPNIVIKKSDIRTATDFNVGKNYIDTELRCTVGVGQLLIMGTAFVVSAIKIGFRVLKRYKVLKKNQSVRELREGVA